MSFSRSVVQAGAVSTHVARRGRQVAKHALAVAVCLACLGVPVAAPVMADELVLWDVPSYFWWHGCGPTAGGMIAGYWDNHGCPDLIPGSSDWFYNTTEIRESIASTGDGDGTENNPGTPGTGHVGDYALYDGVNDKGWDPPYPDMSEVNPGGAHSHDCLADFMGTSRSDVGKGYGSTRSQYLAGSYDISTGMADYTSWRGYSFNCDYDGWIFTPSFQDYVNELKCGRPVLMLVDSNGDGTQDHYVAGIGYRNINGYDEYGCLDTWGDSNHVVRWERWRDESSSYEWGVDGYTCCRPTGWSDASCVQIFAPWHQSSTWNSGVPGSNSFVEIGDGRTVTVSQLANCRMLTLHGTLGLQSQLYADDVRNYKGTLNFENSNARLQTSRSVINDGQINLSNGLLYTQEDLYVGYGELATLTQTGGSVVADGLIRVGVWENAYGQYQMYNGTTEASRLEIGYRADGAFAQSNGSLTINGDMVLGCEVAAGRAGVGSYGITGGGLNVHGYVYAGMAGQGTFAMNGGTCSVDDIMYVAHDADSTGLFHVEDGSLSTSALFVGYHGDGAAQHEDGSVFVTNYITLGRYSDGRGEYQFDGGSLSCKDLYVADQGHGEITQTGGVLLATSSVHVGSSTKSGYYYLEGGELNAADVTVSIKRGMLSVTDGRVVANTIDIQPYANLQSLGGEIRVNHLHGLSTYGVFDGTLTIGHGGGDGSGSFDVEFNHRLAVDELIVGYDAPGAMTQWEGNLDVDVSDGCLILGDQPTGNGSYTLRDGNLDAWHECVGSLGTGHFTQLGGVNTVGYLLSIGGLVGSNGVYDLDGGSLITDQLDIGLYSTGRFNWNDGSLSAQSIEVFSHGVMDVHQNMTHAGDLSISGQMDCDANTLSIADTTGGSAELWLYNGSLTGGTLEIGVGGDATALWYGGTLAFDTIRVGPDGTFETNQNWHVDCELDLEGGQVDVGDPGGVGSEFLRVGVAAPGEVTVSNGGALRTMHTHLGESGSIAGGMTVTGDDSTFETGGLNVGYFGDGTLDITAGGAVTCAWANIARQPGSSGAATVDDGTWTVNGNLNVGFQGNGQLTIDGDALVDLAEHKLYVWSQGQLNFNGGTLICDEFWSGGYHDFDAGSHLRVNYLSGHPAFSTRGSLALGHSGSDLMQNISSGQYLHVDEQLIVGYDSKYQIGIGTGGEVSSRDGYLGFMPGSIGGISLTGPNASWTNTQGMHVGLSGAGYLTVSGGALVSCHHGALGYCHGSTADVRVSGDDSTLTCTDSLAVGGRPTAPGGTASLLIDFAGSVEVAGETHIWSSGAVTVRDGRLTTGMLDVAGGSLALDSPACEVVVSQCLRLGPGSSFSVVPGTTIHMTGSALENQSTDPLALAGLENLAMIFEGGNDDVDPFEVAGMDLGATLDGWNDNFALAMLRLGDADVGRVQLVDLFDNQPGWTGNEALYVSELIVEDGSELDLNGLNLYYYTASIDPGATILLNGGTLQSVTETPLPGDLNGDGFVGGDDLDIIRSFWGQNVTPGDPFMGDPSGDGFVGGDDLDIVRSNWGQGTPPELAAIPEPGTLILLFTGVAGMVLGRRR